MQKETKVCQNCKQNFTIEPEDFEFYAKIKVPPPTFCPECRLIRRLLFRNERSLYKRTDAFGKDTISIYAPEKPFTVYPRDYWWSDAWDPIQYGRDYDFSKPFFQQFRELLEAVPVAGVFSSNVVNSPYTNHVGYLKNCYLIFASWEVENTYYSDKVIKSKDSFDVYRVDRCELCYSIVDSRNSYRLMFSMNSDNCSNSIFLYDCKNCQNCFGCVGLRNKQYHIFNQPYSKEEYERKIKEFDLESLANFSAVSEKVLEHWRMYPRRFARLTNTVKVVGNSCENVKNCYWCFDLGDNVEDSKYLVHGGLGMRDSYDGYGVGICEMLYEGIDSGIGGGSKEKFSVVVYSSNDTDYCFNVENSSNLFGCIGLRKKQYCILNKQYPKEEYETLRAKIVEHMSTLPYKDKKGREYRYGEFFPAEISPFSYNETIAQEYYPLSKEQAIEAGYSWRDPNKKEWDTSREAKDLPDRTSETPESITNERIGCKLCGKAYRILKNEYDFLKKENLPLPRQCPDCRHKIRFESRNPLKLWHRQCRCAGTTSENGVYQNTIEHFHKTNHCPNEFETSYAPERPEIVYCEACYQNEVA